jgi:hypothetical protein
LDDQGPVSVAALNQRLGIHKRGAARRVGAIAELADGQPFVAVATEHQSRPRPGCAAATSPWSESGRVILRFGETDVQLIGGLKDELAIIADLARSNLGAVGLASHDELHDLARAKLGRLHSVALDLTVRWIPDVEALSAGRPER